MEDVKHLREEIFHSIGKKWVKAIMWAPEEVQEWVSWQEFTFWQCNWPYHGPRGVDSDNDSYEEGNSSDTQEPTEESSG